MKACDLFCIYELQIQPFHLMYLYMLLLYILGPKSSLITMVTTHRKSSAFAEKAPSEAEIEEFFAVTEDYVRKQFAEK